jgi:hypothetical protein
MRWQRSLIAVVVVAGCGRIGFDPGEAPRDSLLGGGDGQVGGPIAFDNATGSIRVTGTASVSFMHVVGNDAGRLLLVAVAPQGDISPPTTATSVTFAGAPMTLVRRDSTLDRMDATWWQLTDPPAGTGTVAVGLDGIPVDEALAFAISFSGVDQTTPIEQHAGELATSASLATVTDGAWVVDLQTNNNGSASACAGQTERVLSDGTSELTGSTKGPLSPGPLSMCWSDVGGRRIVSALALKPG